MYSSGKAPTWPGRSESSYRAVCLARHKQVVTHGAWRQTEGLLAVLSQQWAAGLLTEQRAASLIWKPLLGARVALEVQACMSLGFNTNVSIPVLLWPVALGPAFRCAGFWAVNSFMQSRAFERGGPHATSGDSHWKDLVNSESFGFWSPYKPTHIVFPCNCHALIVIYLILKA